MLRNTWPKARPSPGKAGGQTERSEGWDAGPATITPAEAGTENRFMRPERSEGRERSEFLMKLIGVKNNWGNS